MEFIQRRSMLAGKWKHSITSLKNTKIYVLGGIKSKNWIK